MAWKRAAMKYMEVDIDSRIVFYCSNPGQLRACKSASEGSTKLKVGSNVTSSGLGLDSAVR